MYMLGKKPLLCVGIIFSVEHELTGLANFARKKTPTELAERLQLLRIREDTLFSWIATSRDKRMTNSGRASLTYMIFSMT